MPSGRECPVIVGHYEGLAICYPSMITTLDDPPCMHATVHDLGLVQGSSSGAPSRPLATPGPSSGTAINVETRRCNYDHCVNNQLSTRLPSSCRPLVLRRTHKAVQ